MTYPKIGTLGGENTLVSVVANVLAFGIFKKVFHVYAIFLLVLSTNSDVVKVRKGSLEIIFLYKLPHLSLKTRYTICDAKGLRRVN